MSFRSERGVRNIIAVATGISLFGVVSALIDYSNSHNILFAGNGMTDVPRISPPGDATRSYAVNSASEHLFSSGKHDRADTAGYIAKSDEQSDIVTATLTPIDVFDKPPLESELADKQTVNRQTKGDPLTASQMSLAKHIPPVDDRETAAVFQTLPPLADARVEEDTASSHKAEQKAGPIRMASLSEADEFSPEMMNGPALKPVGELASPSTKSASSDLSAKASEKAIASKKVAKVSKTAETAETPKPVKTADAANAPDETRETFSHISASAAHLPKPKKPKTGKAAWDELVKLASVKGGDGEEAPTIFGGLTEKEFKARELRCMATAVYFEARDEPLRGQIAVAQVVMTRVRSEYYPMTICGVVYQNQWRKNSCQFSFACDGHPDQPKEKKEWATSLDVARQVISGKVYLNDIGGSTHYHATYVKPRWRKLVKRVKKIGRHIFYKASFAPPLVANADYDDL
jgi:spore germination cell wall hydrolase CwlJ-like protein